MRVTVGDHTYRTTVASMGGRFLVPLSVENRTAAGVAAGEEVDVELVLDEAPREVSAPPDLRAALASDDPARTTDSCRERSPTLDRVPLVVTARASL